MTGSVGREDHRADTATKTAPQESAAAAELVRLPNADRTPRLLLSRMPPVIRRLTGIPQVPTPWISTGFPLLPAVELDTGLTDAVRALATTPKPVEIQSWPFPWTGMSPLLKLPTAPNGRRAGRFRQSVAAATAKARAAATIAEFGDALRALHTAAGWSQKQLAKRFGPGGENIVGLSMTALSNAFNGYQLFQTDEQVRHIVTACGATPDVEVWVAAYHRVKKNGGRRPRGRHVGGGAAPAHTEPAPTPPNACKWQVSARPVSLLSGPDNEVVHVLQVPITRGQLRATIMSMVVLAVVTSTTDSPSIRAAGLTALTTLTAAAGLIAGPHGWSSTAA